MQELSSPIVTHYTVDGRNTFRTKETQAPASENSPPTFWLQPWFQCCEHFPFRPSAPGGLGPGLWPGSSFSGLGSFEFRRRRESWGRTSDSEKPKTRELGFVAFESLNHTNMSQANGTSTWVVSPLPLKPKNILQNAPDLPLKCRSATTFLSNPTGPVHKSEKGVGTSACNVIRTPRGITHFPRNFSIMQTGLATTPISSASKLKNKVGINIIQPDFSWLVAKLQHGLSTSFGKTSPPPFLQLQCKHGRYYLLSGVATVQHKTSDQGPLALQDPLLLSSVLLFADLFRPQNGGFVQDDLGQTPLPHVTSCERPPQFTAACSM